MLSCKLQMIENLDPMFVYPPQFVCMFEYAASIDQLIGCRNIAEKKKR